MFMAALPGAANFKAGLAAYDRGDYAAALQEWQAVADRGDPNAEYNVALMAAMGRGMTQDYSRAAEWYRKAAEQGVAAAQYNLGVMCAIGQGVEQNNAEAIQWFLKAAEQGMINAEINLGDLYSDKGPSQNYTEAGKWYRKAADHGIASAAFRLGLMYDLGQGVMRDYDEAVKWYTQAADAGYAPALTNLGILYYNAQGVKRDLVQAYTWMARARQLGDQRAGELLQATAKRMRPKDVKKAEVLAMDWQPSAKPASAMDEANFFKQPETAVATSSVHGVNAAPAASADDTNSADRAAPEADVASDPALQPQTAPQQ